jgi:hypothetical protein
VRIKTRGGEGTDLEDDVALVDVLQHLLGRASDCGAQWTEDQQSRSDFGLQEDDRYSVSGPEHLCSNFLVGAYRPVRQAAAG